VESNSESMIITSETLEKGLSKNGGYSLKQLNLFGVKKFSKGWKKDLIGRSFPRELVNQFIDLKDRHLGIEPNILYPPLDQRDTSD
jgi:hypothetical protein